ncbi:MAG: lysophospholipid acyltransferase family protein [Rickettsiales bacterium]|nr:lysophospholipid acyltransferase family protein [Rickettsiales bacterium]
MMKRWFKHPAVVMMLSHLIAAYIRLVYYTSRIEKHYPDAALPFLQGEQQVIIAFWHARLLLMPMLDPPGRTMHVLSSGHRDGRLMAETMQRFKISTVFGSRTKGGAAALRGLMRVLKANDNICITPDGPRGPVRIASSGIAHIAKISGLYILPVAFSTLRHHRMRSWDRFFLAMPFTKIVFVAGNPMTLQKDMSIEDLRKAIEDELNRITDDADQRAGVMLDHSLPPR